MRLYFFILIILWLVLSMFSNGHAAVVTSVDCQAGGWLHLQNKSNQTRSYSCMGTDFSALAGETVDHYCSGVMSVLWDTQFFASSVISDPSISVLMDIQNGISIQNPVSWGQSFSFLAGLLTGVAFVMAAGHRWV